MTRIYRLPHFFLLFCLLFITNITFSQAISEQKNIKKYNGFFNFYYQEKEDKMYLEVKKDLGEFLYVHSLTTGVGSNDLGLDRGQIGDGVVVYFKKAGNKLLLVQPNQEYRAVTDNKAEKTSVAQAFATSVLFGFKIEETTATSFIVNLTPFLLQDTHKVSKRLKDSKEGTYKLDTSRSALAMDRTRAFPKNVEFEALLTLKGEPTGKQLQSVVPNPNYVTVNQHHSFVKLPDNNYKKRIFDPRSGAMYFSYQDYATPIDEPLVKRFIYRHRLEKKNPGATLSEPVEPIIYYLDPGTPEPVRSALLEGASWWDQAFTSIGFKNAFQVKMLPEDADPLDLRYNVIQWVHRSTRGWSYGASVADPRTGEILKGHVSLGSLRIRQDYLIAQALLNKPFDQQSNAEKTMLEMALARIRQLSAHEVGHTLGFAHNFAASTNSRASVMDYPHPKIELKNGEIDLTNAYDTKIGAWDKISVAYTYSVFTSEAEEKEKLSTLLQNAHQNGLRYITDQDARPRNGSHAYAHLWDNGGDPVKELNHILEVRKTAMTNFSEKNIKVGETYSSLEDVFVPLYFLHRYQTEAVAKIIGGLEYTYASRGDGQQVVKVVDAKMQKKALEALLQTLTAAQLAIPEEKLKLFPPRSFGYPKTRESFKGKTGLSFDALSATETATDMTLGFVLEPQRCSRLIQQKSLDNNTLGLKELLEILQKEIYKNTASQSAYYQEISFLVSEVFVKHLKNLAVAKNVLPQVNAIATNQLQQLQKRLETKETTYKDYYMYQAQQIAKFLEKPEQFTPIPAPKIPDGSPIGSFCGGFDLTNK
ncbi:zinc-dependent metalloprotease [Aquimarina sp. ERC-38]|uniref:zinc-dependent metalloprotease n=1 Tax=Aquimarina sp. ERC-38 TaxID=2949996 RepID=UPI00224817E5|nr:zinc-dependent metalloprotease [Aquimarina sp. ERC-38]UZO79620.1 zinc-dependent metalloprotease [Aquimarina sp. ERC-38]